MNSVGCETGVIIPIFLKNPGNPAVFATEARWSKESSGASRTPSGSSAKAAAGGVAWRGKEGAKP